jgi:hypothetical protein
MQGEKILSLFFRHLSVIYLHLLSLVRDILSQLYERGRQAQINTFDPILAQTIIISLILSVKIVLLFKRISER